MFAPVTKEYVICLKEKEKQNEGVTDSQECG